MCWVRSPTLHWLHKPQAAFAHQPHPLEQQQQTGVVVYFKYTYIYLVSNSNGNGGSRHYTRRLLARLSVCAQPPTLQCGAECSGCCVTQRAFVYDAHKGTTGWLCPHMLWRLPAHLSMCGGGAWEVRLGRKWKCVCVECARREKQHCASLICVILAIRQDHVCACKLWWGTVERQVSGEACVDMVCHCPDPLPSSRASNTCCAQTDTHTVVTEHTRTMQPVDRCGAHTHTHVWWRAAHAPLLPARKQPHVLPRTL